jgi:MoxR-like ATPase
MRFTQRHFDPAQAGGESLDGGVVAFRAGDRPTDLYLYPPRTILALNVALATGRPLLIAGEPGSGKSTLAENAAAVLGWSYYKQMVTSRTRATDLLYTFDALRRLSHATTPGMDLREDRYYVEPATLWWAFDPDSAANRGLKNIAETDRAQDPVIRPGRAARAVVLLDEIDKADPDVPNDLLEPFDLRSFRVAETDEPIPPTRDALLILTTNGERELPPAFMRRCITLTLDPPDVEWFVSIADKRYPQGDGQLHRGVAEEVVRLREEAKRKRLRPAGTGEYLDALAACRELDVDTGHDAWSDVAQSVLWKHDRTPIPTKVENA